MRAGRARSAGLRIAGDHNAQYRVAGVCSRRTGRFRRTCLRRECHCREAPDPSSGSRNAGRDVTSGASVGGGKLLGELPSQLGSHRKEPGMALARKRNPNSYFGRLTLLKKYFWLYFLLLIFEGALRKWVAPQLSA